MPRTPFIVGNWKMNTSREEAVRLATAIASEPISAVHLALCPPFPWLIPVAAALAGTQVDLGAQNCWTEPNGAFTGEVSPTMLAEICRYVLIGHSERRRVLGEPDELIAKKLRAALTAGIEPILCVGEDLETRQAGSAVSYVKAQLEHALASLSKEEIGTCTFAYEPIWAIGTGVAAEPSDAEEMAAEVRSVISSVAGADVAHAARILYGGSVTPANAAAILANENVDGALVGGASLKAESFLRIARAAV